MDEITFTSSYHGDYSAKLDLGDDYEVTFYLIEVYDSNLILTDEEEQSIIGESSSMTKSAIEEMLTGMEWIVEPQNEDGYYIICTSSEGLEPFEDGTVGIVHRKPATK